MFQQQLPARLPLRILRQPRQRMQLYRHGRLPLSEKNHGPAEDRIDIPTSKIIHVRVQAARERQLERFTGTKLTCNAEMSPTEVRDFCQTDTSGEKLLKAAVQQLHLSARAYHRMLKLARTIADLAGSEMIAPIM
jgi:predicted ATPase with chaperone activity